MKDSELEWFRPLWLRLVVTGLVAVWAGYEILISHDTLWITITLVALAYAVWNLFIKFDANKPAAPGDKGSKPPA